MNFNMIKKTYIIFIFVFLFACPFFVFADNFPSLKLPYIKGEKREISQGYNTSFTHYGKDKYALDFNLPGEADLGKVILAVADGIVYTKTQRGKKDLYDGYGKYIDIDHGNGYISRYAHLQKFAVKNNQKVKQGQIIGYVNSTGKSTGSHLHFALYKKSGSNYIAIKPEPMSGERNFVAGQWYTSNNRIYVKSPVEKAKSTVKKIVRVPEGAIVPEGSFSFWDKFLFYTKGFLANYRDFFGNHPIKDTKKQEQRKKNNKKSSLLEKEIWNQKFTGRKVATFTWVRGERSSVDTVTFQFKNTGNTTWKKNKVFLNVMGGYEGTAIKFYYKGNWLTKLRPCTFQEKEVRPGELATFDFIITYPKKIGKYYPQFTLSRFNGKKWITFGKDRAIFLALVKRKKSELSYGAANVNDAVNQENNRKKKTTKKSTNSKEEKSILSISQFPMTYHDPQGSGTLPFSGPGMKLSSFKFLSGDKYDVFGSPVIDSKGNIYFSVYRKYGRKGILALDRDLNEKWFFSIEENIYRMPALLEKKNSLYVVSMNRFLSINIKNGNLNWQRAFYRTIDNQYPIIDDNGRLYIIAGVQLPDGLKAYGLISFNSETGRVNWLYNPIENRTYYDFDIPTEGTFSGHSSNFCSPPVVDKKGTVYFGFKNDIFAVNSKGEKVWKKNFTATTCEEGGTNVLPEVNYVSISKKGDIYATVYRNQYTGCGNRERWDTCLRSINLITKEEQWSNPPCYEILQRPSFNKKGEVYFTAGGLGDSHPRLSLYKYDKDGNLKNNKLLDFYGVIDSILVDWDDNVYILDDYLIEVFDKKMDSSIVNISGGYNPAHFSIGNHKIYTGRFKSFYVIEKSE